MNPDLILYLIIFIILIESAYLIYIIARVETDLKKLLTYYPKSASKTKSHQVDFKSETKPKKKTTPISKPNESDPDSTSGVVRSLHPEYVKFKREKRFRNKHNI